MARTFATRRSNLVRNPSFEIAPSFVAATTATGRWIDGTAAGSAAVGSGYGWGITTKGGTVAAQFDGSEFADGAGSMKVSTTATASFVEVRPLVSTTVANVARTGIPASASSIYTATFSLKTNLISGTATNGANLSLLEYAASSTTVLTTTNVIATSVKTTTGWTTYTKTFTTQGTTAFIVPSLIVYGQQGTATLIMDAWFDAISLSKGALSRLSGVGRTGAGTRTAA